VTTHVVIGLDEEVINIVSRWEKRRFSMAGSFPILFREAWKEDIQVFAAEGDGPPPERVAANVLNRHPVEVLPGCRRDTEYL
jgi:hypothetical protein